uniref:Glyoxalase/fosfomycin resistance/dioxygenase domain-containing protein n=1 Tax=Mammaliicoccus stepanovicii TaxID=643214 RepID=A0A0K2JN27_9STAP|nr:hypothetical protein [Mammaliicoccus stepanovicii]
MEFYQMPLFNKLLVKDIEKAEKWYKLTLGFRSVFKFRNEDNESFKTRKISGHHADSVY